eukprot:8930429-Pyramimonas_sp.AAC.1
MCQRNRNIGLPNLSSRITTRAALGVAGSFKFSSIEGRAAAVLKEARAHAVEAQSIIDREKERWTTPAPDPLPEEAVINAIARITDPSRAHTEGWKWATVMSILFSRHCKDSVSA